MCDICHRRRCPPACPSNEAGKIGRCALCREPITEAEPALVDAADGRLFHAECLENRSPVTLLAHFGITLTELELTD